MTEPTTEEVDTDYVYNFSDLLSEDEDTGEETQDPNHVLYEGTQQLKRKHPDPPPPQPRDQPRGQSDQPGLLNAGDKNNLTTGPQDEGSSNQSQHQTKPNSSPLVERLTPSANSKSTPHPARRPAPLEPPRTRRKKLVKPKQPQERGPPYRKLLLGRTRLADCPQTHPHPSPHKRPRAPYSPPRSQ
jgi:hypothetical protein